MRRDDITQAILDLRRAGELLALPLDCTQHHHCTLGDHLYDATRDMTPGPRAQSFEPPTSNGHHPPADQDPPPDPTTIIDIRYTQTLTAAWTQARNLIRLIDTLRPDRYIPLPEPASDDQWCSNHLQVMGMCEPRHRGDLCRACYELGLTYHTVPDRQCMQDLKDAGYRADRIINAWVARLPQTTAKKRRSRAS